MEVRMEKILRTGIAGCLLIWALASCSLTDEAMINSRIDNFLSGLNNSDRTNLWMNFHPDMTVREQTKDPTYFNSTPLDYSHHPFSLNSQSGISDIGGDQKQVTAKMDRESGTLQHDVIFIMQKYGSEWLIREFDLDVWNALKSTGLQAKDESIDLR
jgi:hypothetical protein